ncbi:MAG: leucine-rich repeat domain-containing protein [Bacteroidaceae bacterium]|nr:leucine-rich repeat domain-containing protein [Bacteroidaceae bacterium]
MFKKLLSAAIIIGCIVVASYAIYSATNEVCNGEAKQLVEFENNGISYRMIPGNDLTCEVIRYKRGCEILRKGKKCDTSLQYKGSVAIPESVSYNGKEYRVTGICGMAFKYCDSLTAVFIPASVIKIGDNERDENIFEYCPLLEKIVVAHNNPVYDSREHCNAIVKTASNTLVAGCKNSVIPADIEKIGDNAFEGCSLLEEINIPAGVTAIGEYAFANCRALARITVDENNSVYDSRENCNAIIETATNSIVVGSNNTLVPKGITEIGKCAFMGRSILKSIALPVSVTKIGHRAFKGCVSLTEIEVPAPEIELGSHALNGSGWYNNQPDGFIYFKEWLADFKGEKKAEMALDIKEGTEKMVYLLLKNSCDKFTSVNIPASFTGSLFGCFIDVPEIERITVNPNNPVYDSREGCNAIIATATNTLMAACKNTVVPSTVTALHNDAFCYVKGLDSIYIPALVSNIGNGCFTGCSDLEKIVVDEENPVYDSRKGCNAIIETATNTLMAACKNTVIPQGVKTIAYDAFGRQEGIENIVIPEGVEVIESSAFRDCKGLKKVVLPSTLHRIDRWAFINCTALATIECRGAVAPKIDEQAFRGVPASAQLLYNEGDYTALKASFPGEIKKSNK